MQVLVIDIGGNNVKLKVEPSDQDKRKFSSGPTLTPQRMVEQVKEMTADLQFDHVIIGYPGPVADDRVLKEPHNLGAGWLEFDVKSAFELPTKLVNDAAMQAFGSFEGGKMLFLGLGTGLGATLVAKDVILPLEVAHMPYKDGMTFEDFVGKRGLDRLGKKRWREVVIDVAWILKQGLVADYIVFGGGNAKRLQDMPDWCRIGSNANAFKGGFEIWQNKDLRML